MVDVKEVTPATAKQWVDEGKAVLIDVREVNEWDAENIPGATLAPLSQFAAAQLPDEKDKIAIFHCRSGRRTEDYFPLFVQTGFADVYHMAGGILAWKEEGYPVQSPS